MSLLFDSSFLWIIILVLPFFGLCLADFQMCRKFILFIESGSDVNCLPGGVQMALLARIVCVMIRKIDFNCVLVLFFMELHNFRKEWMGKWYVQYLFGLWLLLTFLWFIIDYFILGLNSFLKEQMDFQLFNLFIGLLWLGTSLLLRMSSFL